MEILRKESLNESSRSLFYSSKEIYVHDDHPISFFEPRGVELGVGEHSFEFSVPLEPNLPSSFKGSYGSIKYKLRIVIQRPWSFDEKHQLQLNVVKQMLIPQAYRLNPTPLTKQITKTISLFGNRPITLVTVLPADFAVRNEKIKLLVTVANNSNMNVEKLKFSIIQLITYHSHVPLRIHKQESIVIFQKETGNVIKKSERTFAHELPVPPCQPSDDELSGVINIRYEIRVEAVLRGFFKNLVLTLPFKIYSRDPESNNARYVPPPPPVPPPNYSDDRISRDSGAGNPFEEPSSTIPNYIELNSSLSSSVVSPSIISQYSESSSIHSTNSDSSATTLSPAMGTGISYDNSESSSQFNTSSPRSSLRSSIGGSIVGNVPYVPYSSSPLMVNSYPPAHAPLSHPPIPDSPQYSLMNNIRVTSPLQSFSCLPSTSATFLSRLHPQPPGALDLPPSYEELFGTAPTPEESPK